MGLGVPSTGVVLGVPSTGVVLMAYLFCCFCDSPLQHEGIVIIIIIIVTFMQGI